MSPFSNNWTIIFPYKKVESADIRGVLVYVSYESEVSVVDQPKVNIDLEIPYRNPDNQLFEKEADW